MNREELDEIEEVSFRERFEGHQAELPQDVFCCDGCEMAPALLAEIDRLNATLVKILDLHEPRTDYRQRHVCDYCSGLCHSRSGLGCDDPDAPWPCETVRIATTAEGIADSGGAS